MNADRRIHHASRGGRRQRLRWPERKRANGQRRQLLTGLVIVAASITLVVYAGRLEAAADDVVDTALTAPWAWVLAIAAAIFAAVCLAQRHRASRGEECHENPPAETRAKPPVKDSARRQANGGPSGSKAEAFSQALQRHWDNCAVQASCLALFAIRIDDFSRLCDAFRHSEMRQRLDQVERSLDSLACSRGGLIDRTDGDGDRHFRALMANTTPDEALQVAEDMRQAVEDLDLPGATSARQVMTVSIGMAIVVPERNRPPRVLDRSARRALHRALELGRNRIGVDLIDDAGSD